MPLILHLSDLHLSPGKEPAVGDYKASEVIPPKRRQKRSDYLAQSLRALGDYLRARDESLDSIVVTGDVSYQCSRRGMRALDKLLRSLGDRKPPNSSIIVVPGNHDVVSGLSPSDPARYAPFLKTIGAAGYVVPQVTKSPPGIAPLILRDKYVIVPLNSTAYCNTRFTFTDDAEREWRSLVKRQGKKDPLVRNVEKLRWLYGDAVRIDRSDMQRVSSLLKRADPGAKRTRILALHHQLGPVSADEEVKPFEGLINAGEVRQFLSDSNIDVVLHGHKHLPRVAEEFFTPYGERADDPSRRSSLVVISCGSIDNAPGQGREVAKLLEVVGGKASRRLRVTPVQSVGPGSPLAVKSDGSLNSETVTFRLTRGSLTPNLLTLRGRTAGDVHEQIEGRHHDGVEDGHPCICIVDSAASAAKIPPSYPSDAGVVGDRQTWFEELVAWWQSEPPISSGSSFTHGQFIHGWADGSRVLDQLDGVVDSLKANANTSRAVVTLLDPSRYLQHQSAQFPALCFLQFVRQRNQVDIIANFRKQEMRYWWPINVGELALLLEKVTDRLCRRGHEVGIGRIVTVANMAMFSRSTPKVAIPRLERLALHQDDQQFVAYALALALSGQATLERREELRVALRELALPERMPVDGAPVAPTATDQLVGSLESIGTTIPLQGSTEKILSLLRQLRAETERVSSRSDLDRQSYSKMKNTLNSVIERLVNAIGELPADG